MFEYKLHYSMKGAFGLWQTHIMWFNSSKFLALQLDQIRECARPLAHRGSRLRKSRAHNAVWHLPNCRSRGEIVWKINSWPRTLGWTRLCGIGWKRRSVPINWARALRNKRKLTERGVRSTPAAAAAASTRRGASKGHKGRKKKMHWGYINNFPPQNGFFFN